MVEVMKKVSEKYEENVKAARKSFPKALVFDVTMQGAMKWLDPDFPIGKVKIPGMGMKRGLSIRNIWEGLKVFEKNKENDEKMKNEVIDERWMTDERKIGKKRGCKCWKKVVGIKIGEEVVEIGEARKIFQELYEEIIKERYGHVLRGIREEAEKRPVVLLDYQEEDERPLNHAEILKNLIAA